MFGEKEPLKTVFDVERIANFVTCLDNVLQHLVR